jgi:hypothetical protein
MFLGIGVTGRMPVPLCLSRRLLKVLEGTCWEKGGYGDGWSLRMAVAMERPSWSWPAVL